MAKKRKRRPRPDATSGAAPAPERAREAERPTQGDRRRRRKEEARRLREEERKRIRRRSLLRRGAVLGVLSAAAVGVFLFVRAQAPGAIPAEARAAAEAAGCTDVATPVSSAPGGQHLQPGESFTYDQRPATSGTHDPRSLPAEPKVNTSPVPETLAVHNLEHAYVIVYYRAEGPEALPAEVVDRLAGVVQGEDKVLMAPYPELPEGASLALAAWNKLQTCPSSISPEQADEVAAGFIEAYRGTSNAPEAFAE